MQILTNDQIVELLRDAVAIVGRAAIPDNFEVIAFEIVAKQLFDEALVALQEDADDGN